MTSSWTSWLLCSSRLLFISSDDNHQIWYFVRLKLNSSISDFNITELKSTILYSCQFTWKGIVCESVKSVTWGPSSPADPPTKRTQNPVGSERPRDPQQLSVKRPSIKSIKMGDKETKLRGQVINKPKEQMWMLKSESVSGNLVNFLGTFFITADRRS